MQFTTSIKSFSELSNEELYAIIRLRNEVFVVEQNCVFQDADNKDQKAFHVQVKEGNELAAYTRILPTGISYEEVSIGRVVSDMKFRGTGAGRKVMQESMNFIQRTYGNCVVRISAQTYLLKFYKSLGFQEVGEVYLEDDIEHIEMVAQL